ncbi:isopeptide-forming domain-containing fimbrial protein [Bifidobacterium sp. ESL0690]|uniref:isopeptide-forming domain-containing fimbrial protein n=1 Tax=Bifidobacterium sp. ESL0690 TaxID=2983214 RepID=UPI0023F785D2|nr:isopeptide-forming domain-containing fimbrial protein [Bifidobacterium sp. ESL0690]WEV46615.1 isopeptide-forming domain-containing fimbrial protein [Bifidobacterium sp. ESL0690]
MKQGRVTKLLASLAACVAGVAMMGVGVTSASAVEAQPNVDLDITGDSTVLANHVFHAVKLADYINQEAGSVGISTVATRKAAIVAAAGASGTTISAKQDAMATLVAKWGGDGGEKASPYAGLRRDFVNELVKQNDIKTAMTAGDASATFDAGTSKAHFNIPNGIYVIEDVTSGSAAVSIPILVSTVGKTATSVGSSTIEAKITQVTTEKKRNKPTFDVGEYVHYTITSVVPVYTNLKSMQLDVVDTLSKGLTFDPNYSIDPVIKVNGSTLNDTDYTLSIANADGSPAGASTAVPGATLTFSLGDYIKKKIDVNDFSLAGKNITIDFYAMVNKDALTSNGGNSGNDATGIVNDAKTVYTNNASDHVVTVPADKVYVYTGSFTVKKFSETNKETALTGAEFNIYKGDGVSGDPVKFVASDPATADGVNQYRRPEARDHSGSATLTAPFKVNGLADGTYTVKETKAPEGYKLIDDFTFTVTIEHDATAIDEAGGKGQLSAAVTYTLNKGKTTPAKYDLAAQDGTNKFVFNVYNVQSLSQLPASGAAGILMRVVAGLLLVGIAVGLYAIMRHTQRSRRAVRRH